VMLESGWTWLPALLWRIAKYWGGLRFEIPWADRSPAEIVRDQVRFSLTPTDAPANPDHLRRVLDHIGSDDVLLFSTDYPHAQFTGSDVFHPGIPDALRDRISATNPLATYPRIAASVEVPA